MKRARTATLAFAAAPLALAAFGCGNGAGSAPDAAPAAPDAAPPDPSCPVEEGEGVSFDPEAAPCEKLSSYRFFTDAVAQEPNEGVVPFDVNSPLFSDYAGKERFVWLPEGTEIAYREGEPFAFPIGAVIIKTFWYPTDARDPDAGRRLIETRLLVHREEGWDGHVYQWDEDQSEARRNRLGDVVSVSWTDGSGEAREHDYIVPDVNQCKACHVNDDDTVPIGPKARHFNRDFHYAGGTKNQLVHLGEIGYLEGAPADPEDAPRAPVWDDADSGTLQERARAWLDINCAHCHNPSGPGGSSGLDLQATQTDPYKLGVCKPPVAAGDGSGGLDYGIVPGEPDASILVYRIESRDPSVQMPELLRNVRHEEGIALIRDWIAPMEGSCDEEEAAR